MGMPREWREEGMSMVAGDQFSLTCPQSSRPGLHPESVLTLSICLAWAVFLFPAAFLQLF